MSWIENKDKWMGRRPRRKPRPQKVERVYTVSEVAELLSVSRNTVFKWLALNEDDDAPIAYDQWFKLPNGHIRVRESALKKLMGAA